MPEQQSLHDKLRSACRKVDGDIEEDSIGVDTTKCVTEHGTMSVRETRKRIFSDKTKVTVSGNESDLSSSSKDIEDIKTSWGRINARSDTTSFELKGGRPT